MHLRSSWLVLGLALTLACGPSSDSTTVTPESLDDLVLYDSYGELLVAVFDGLRKGDLATVRASIASDGQLETMCSDYSAPTGGPYEPPSIVAASDHCKEVFAAIPEAAIQESLKTHPYGVDMHPPVDSSFEMWWRERCPADFAVYELVGIFEVHGEGTPQAGFEVYGVFTHRDRWGLMTIPRCRGEGE